MLESAGGTITPDKTYSLGGAFAYFRARTHLSPVSLETYAHAKRHFFTILESPGGDNSPATIRRVVASAQR